MNNAGVHVVPILPRPTLASRVISAISNGDFVNLRSLLSQQADDAGDVCHAIKDKDINQALLIAARRGCVESCRLLWERLGPNAKQRYYAEKVNGVGLLHEATANGHLEVVAFFVQECKFSVNQKDHYGSAPLSFAMLSPNVSVDIFEILLLEGAEPNHLIGQFSPLGVFYPLQYAVHVANADLVRLLLNYQADPNPRHEHGFMEAHDKFILRYTDIAIQDGHADILQILLEHCAVVGFQKYGDDYLDDSASAFSGRSTSLTLLLRNQQKSRDAKLAICRILLDWCKGWYHSESFLYDSVEGLIKGRDVDGCQVLLEAGMDPSRLGALDCAIQEGNESVSCLLVQSGANPFIEQMGWTIENAGSSPFITASMQTDTSVFEYFLDLWKERFACAGGKNSDGDLPIHVVCRNPLVPLQVIKLLIKRDADALATVGGTPGSRPLHLAASWDASLDVIFYLLQHCPNALCRVRNAAAAANVAVTAVGPSDSANGMYATRNDEDDEQENGPVKKTAKTSHASGY